MKSSATSSQERSSAEQMSETFLSHLAPSEDATMLTDAAAGFVADRRARLQSHGSGHDPAEWSGIETLGWLGARVGEDHGGLELPLREACVLARLCGQALVTAPFIGSSIVATALLSKVPQRALVDKLLSGIAENTRVVTVSAQSDGLPNGSDVRVQAQERGERLLLSGRIAACEYSEATTDIILGLDTPGGERFLVRLPVDRAGLSAAPYTAVDGRPLAALVLSDVEVEPDEVIAEGEVAETALESAGHVASAALCHELAGALEEICKLTGEYLKDRRQFGRALSEFQVLRHRVADMYTDLEMVNSMAELASFAAANMDDPRAQLLQARYVAASFGRRTGEQAIQLHGGMGMTDEMAIGHYVKRVLYIGSAFGGTWTAVDLLQAQGEAAE